MKNKLMMAFGYLPLLATLFALAPLGAHTDRPENMPDVEYEARAMVKYHRDLAEQEAIENSEVTDEELGEIKVVESRYTKDDIAEYPTTHTGAWHKAIAVSASGNHVSLEDGSGWLVYPSDQKKTLDWYGDDVLLLTMAPWSPFYSFYEYVIINTRTHARVYVGLEEIPDHFNEYTLWIKKIDHHKKHIILSNLNGQQTVWAFSNHKLENWFEGHKILIGVRKPSFFYSSHNFLLNLDAKDYLRSECLY